MCCAENLPRICREFALPTIRHSRIVDVKLRNSFKANSFGEFRWQLSGNSGEFAVDKPENVPKVIHAVAVESDRNRLQPQYKSSRKRVEYQRKSVVDCIPRNSSGSPGLFSFSGVSRLSLAPEFQGNSSVQSPGDSRCLARGIAGCVQRGRMHQSIQTNRLRPA